MNTIKFVDLAKKHEGLINKYIKSLEKNIENGEFILGENVEHFERELENYLNIEFAIGVGNCTDALYLALIALGVKNGDEIITTPMSYLATTSTIVLAGCTPVFADVDSTLNLDPSRIEELITERTRGISLVHLAGVPAQIDRILKIANKHNLFVIEDCAQAFGSSIDEKMVGTFGDIGCFSFHPLKNLGALGDAGAIVTKDKNLYKFLNKARNHGHSTRGNVDFFSHNMRLDAIQAGFLNCQLAEYDTFIKNRNKQVSYYKKKLKTLKESEKINWVLMDTDKKIFCSYNFFMILAERRDELQSYLATNNIDTRVHYEMLLNELSPFEGTNITSMNTPMAQKYAGRILSLPLGSHISNQEIELVAEKISEFYGANHVSK